MQKYIFERTLVNIRQFAVHETSMRIPDFVENCSAIDGHVAGKEAHYHHFRKKNFFQIFSIFEKFRKNFFPCKNNSKKNFFFLQKICFQILPV